MELALQYINEHGEKELDPNDSERFFRIYGEMILNCDLPAIWRHFVFENNLMEEDPANLFDPYTINFEALPEAMSIAFFENRLFLRGTFDDPIDLLRRVDRLKSVNTWVCQGELDEVCPPEYARKLVDALKEAGVHVRAKFLPNAGHEASDPVMGECLKQQVAEFWKTQNVGGWR
jgi:pimeloyl-ACP methyl ester carboxylesterase